MAEDCKVPLLKNKYYEGCPGCKVDQDKMLQRGFPIRQLVSVWIVVLCTASELRNMIKKFQVSTAWGIGLIIGPAMGGFLAQETLHMHGDDNISPDASIDALESASCLSSSQLKQEGSSKKSLLKNWPLMSSIIVYCVFSLHDMAYTEVLSIPILTSYPYIAMLSGVTGLILINCASAVKNVLSISIITGSFILQNKAVDQNQRGAANGISMTVVSLFKAVGPAGGGALFSWAQKRQNAAFLPGNHSVFFVLNVIEAIAILMTFKPFLSTT
ncbi:hypothetical protein LWI29_000762 [Acer saccharum]|uniref:Uncharacterized protein n=1 Tax=Acer saccharum TaxID=4024 RepID=A0AA39SGU5_ACESA|nr:hypothetical protein LWI29_000762 [Acer saccharum]